MAPSVTTPEMLAGATEKAPAVFSSHTIGKLQAASEKASRDFRSDVVTVPTEAMMSVSSATSLLFGAIWTLTHCQSILEATVNDDIYDEEGDPSVKALEARMVELTGMEAALWAVSGTQGNQICLRTHLTQPPHSVLLDHRAHVHCWESGALPVISQAVSVTVKPANGIHLTLEDIKPNMIADGNSK